MSSEEDIEIIDLTNDSSCSDMEEDDDLVDITKSEKSKEKELALKANKSHALKGYKFYEIGEYLPALSCYNAAIGVYAGHSYDWLFRSKIHYKINSYSEALENALFSFRLDIENLECLYWILQLRLETGNIKKCVIIIKVIKDCFPNEVESKTLQEWELKVNRLSYVLQKLDSTDITNPEKTLEIIENVLQIAPACISILLRQAKTLLNMKDYNEARMTCVQVLRIEPENLIAIQYQAIAFYQIGQIRDAINTTNELLKKNANNQEFQNFLTGLTALMQEMEKALSFKNAGNCTEYKIIYNTCMNIFSSADILRNHNLESEFHYNMATLLFNEGNIYECLEFCNKANELNKKYINARVLKAEVYTQHNLLEEAVAELKAVLEAEYLPHIENKLLKLYQTVNYYTVLGLECFASHDAVKKAYKRALLEYHPDKNQGAPEAVLEIKKKQLESSKMAFKVLSDAAAKRVYDQKISKLENKLANYSIKRN